MLIEKEILELKREHHSLEKRMENVEKSQLPSIVKLSEQLKKLIADIESAREKEKSLWNPDINTRIRIAKKLAGLYKELNYFEIGAAGEFEKGNIPEDAGKRFMSIGKLVKDNKMNPAKREFEHFEEIMELSKRYETNMEEIEEEDRTLKREQLRTEGILAEMSGLEKETVDLEKVYKYEELLKKLEEVGEVRRRFIHSLVSKPVVELLEDVEKYSLRDYYPFPGKEETAELKNFFSQYPVFGKCNAGQLCEFFTYSEKKLSHICPETSKFRRVVAEKKSLFETVCSFEKTSFLAVDDENEKILDFYSGIEGAKGIVEKIRELGREKYSYKEEYEKRKRVEEKREELSKYSKDKLEQELKGIKHLTELLHSDKM